MNYKKLIWAAIAAFIFLAAVNAMVFPMVFPNGIGERLLNTRLREVSQYQIAALAVMSMLMSLIYSLSHQGRSNWDGFIFGVLMALFVTLPDHLQSSAILDTPFQEQFLPFAWIAVTWGFAGVIIAIIYSEEQTKASRHSKSKSNTRRSKSPLYQDA